MTSEKGHNLHADHEYERVVAANQRKAERREQARLDLTCRRLAALVDPESTLDDTGFAPGAVT